VQQNIAEEQTSADFAEAKKGGFHGFVDPNSVFQHLKNLGISIFDPGLKEINRS